MAGTASAQFPTKDSLIQFINKWIRNSAVDAFTNLRLNTALIGIVNQADSARIKKVEVSGTTLRIITIGKDTFSVTLPGSGGNTNSNIGSGFRLAVPNTNNIKTVFAGLNLLLDSSTNTNALTFKMDTAGVSSYYLRRKDSTLYVTQTALNAAIGNIGLVSDVRTLSQIKLYSAAQGVASSSNVTNYSHTSVDSAKYKFSTTRAGTAGAEYGGWLAPSTSGDSIRVTAPFGAVGGDSQGEGHPGDHGQLHPLVGGVPQSIYLPGYPDSVGQLTYHLRSLTHMRWYNSGIGGQTSEDLRARFFRDMLGIASNPSDGRGGSPTIPGLPSIVVIIVGINDLFAGITPERTIENLEWMASQCQQRGVRCVVLNLPGEAFHTQTSLRQAQKINQYLKNGVLDQYGACVVDYNRWWQNPSYNDDIHPSSLIVDDIHPTKVGYDSLAHYIFREAKLPVITKAVFINELDPGGFTGYSRPAGITINGNAYSIGSANDTIAITSYVPDSVWIKVTSSTNVTGTSYSGFSSIIWKLDNNVDDSTWYTRKTLYSGSTKMSQSIADLTIQSIDYTTEPSFLIKYPDGTPYMYTRVKGNGQTIFNGSTALNSATLSVYGSIATNGAVTAAPSSFGGLLIGNTSSGGGAGYGVGIVGGALRLDGINGYNNNNAIELKRYFTSTSNLGSNGNANIVNIAGGVDDFTGFNDSAYLLKINATLNNATITQPGNVFGGILYQPVISSQLGVKLAGIGNTRGVNRFNSLGERTVIGQDQAHGSALLDVQRPKQGFLPPRMTTAQRDSIGYIKSISITGGSYTVAPALSITGGTGSGAIAIAYILTGTTIVADIIDPGIGYNPGSAVTVTLTGGTGSGGSASAVISGPDSGLVIYNTSVDSLQFYNGARWVNCGSEAGQYTATLTTTNATPTTAYTIATTTGTKYTVEVTADAIKNDGESAYGAKKFRRILRHTSGGITLASNVDIAADGYLNSLSTATFQITNSGNDIIVEATGEASTTIHWKFTIKVTSVQ
jgi:lysophospholipase L1-like esterase